MGKSRGKYIKKNKIMGIKHFFLHLNAYFTIFFSFEGAHPLQAVLITTNWGKNGHKITPPKFEDRTHLAPFTFYIHF